MRQHDISVIIPVFKEERSIERAIVEMARFFGKNRRIRDYEIIFVADKSGDRTIEIIQAAVKRDPHLKLIVNRCREQKGGSVRIGMLKAKYDPMLFFDADLSTPLREINVFLDQIDDYDIIIGSRGLPESKVKKRMFRVFLSKGFSLFKRVLLGLTVKDTQCGFKMFRKQCKPIFKMQRIKTGTFDVELLVIAKRNNYKLKELPITWVDVGNSNFNALNLVYRMSMDTVMIKRNDLLGKYRMKPASSPTA
jgi:glycosyltransferase involved in cell wall biosynthesis